MERRECNKHIREILDLNQQDLGRMIGKSKRTIINYETGKCKSEKLEKDIESALDRYSSFGKYNRDRTLKNACSIFRMGRTLVDENVYDYIYEDYDIPEEDKEHDE